MNDVLIRGAGALTIILLLAGCGSSTDPSPAVSWNDEDSMYVFNEPDSSFILHAELGEISGLALMEGGLLGAVQDERGVLYTVDPMSGDIIEQHTFGSDGDYEGIDIGGGQLFVIRSDGLLFIFDEWADGAFVGDSLELNLVRDCDAEGIAYQADFERLLISCKEAAGRELKRKKAIFAFDPVTRTLSSDPVYLFDIEEFEATIEDHPINEAVSSILSDRLDLSGFKPSGLAVHPHSGDLFVVSSVTKVVMRVDSTGQVRAMWTLPAERFDQPEGIAFGPGGELYISNEAGDRLYPTLLRFRDRSASSTAISSE